MQLMDATAQSLGVSDPFDPQQNITGGARLLRRLLDQYSGSVRLALAAYNAGSGAVDRYQGVPPYPETQRYVTQVLAAADRLGRSAAPRTTPR
jgi:soluble lytic murein transglycosylase-like protein